MLIFKDLPFFTIWSQLLSCFISGQAPVSGLCNNHRRQQLPASSRSPAGAGIECTTSQGSHNVLSFTAFKCQIESQEGGWVSAPQ